MSEATTAKDCIRDANGRVVRHLFAVGKKECFCGEQLAQVAPSREITGRS